MVRDMVQSLGLAVRVVGKGGVVGIVAKIAATFWPGLCVMLSAAAKVSAGAVPLVGVAAVKSGPQAVPSPVVQVLSASASAESLAVSTVRLAGSVAADPVAGLASRAASRKALVRPSVLVAVAPMVVVLLAKGASAQAAAAVESSLMVAAGVEAR
jgi:hypothetical protein